MRILLVAVVLASWAPPATADPTVSAAQARIKTSSDVFIDDPFAVREDGSAIAYLTTDGASPGTLHLAQLSGADVTVAKMPPNIVALHWVGPSRVLVVQRDPQSGFTSGQVYAAKGPEKERLGPVSEISPAIVDGKAAVVTYARREKKGGVEHQVAAYRPESLRPIARKLFLEDKDGQIANAGGALKPLWWSEGYTTLSALRAGEFDKARDMRRPNRFTRLDVFTGKLRDEHEIEDVLEFTRLTTDHRKQDGKRRFVHLNDDHSKLLLVDGTEEHEVTLDRPLSTYDATTLGQQVIDDGRLAISLTVDPTNPAALGRKKADPDQLDLYFVDTPTRKASLMLRVDGEGRPNAWKIGGRKLVLLRKSKGFDRGGVSLDIFELGL